MIVPSAMNIESALDPSQDKLSDWAREHQIQELRTAMGAAMAKVEGIQFPLSQEFIAGYMLGLATARVVLRGSTALMIKGVNPEDVL